MGKLVDFFRYRFYESEAYVRRQRDLWRMANETLLSNLLHHGDVFKDPLSILGHGFKVYSQNEEDGLIEYLLGKIGTDNRTFVEFGTGEGLENNSMYLLLKGWSGLWIEGDPSRVEFAKQHFHRLIDAKRLQVIHGMVTPKNIESHLQSAGIPAELDVLSIDIDGNDYWVWQAIEKFRPRLVVMEYNVGFGPTAEWIMKFDPDHYWKGGRNFGASLKSYELLGTSKGYRLVGCNLNGTNAFFVRSDLIGGHFSEPYTSEHHFQPNRFVKFFAGHPADPREVDGFLDPSGK